MTFNRPVSFRDAFFEEGVVLWKTDFEQGVDKTGSNMDGNVEEEPSDSNEVD